MSRAHLALVAVGAAALAGGGTAVAAGGHTHRAAPAVPLAVARPLMFQPAGLPAAATYLGTTVDALATQLRSGKTLGQIANATSGKSVQGLIDALVAAAKAHLGATVPPDLTQRITDLVNGVRALHRHWGMHAGGPGLQAAATYLGTTVAALQAQLQSGKTLAQIADATSGKSAQGLIDALTALAKQRITDFVNGKHP
jgi:ABC-type microcin C transport system duplicated ATPase subunit YejF